MFTLKLLVGVGLIVVPLVVGVVCVTAAQMMDSRPKRWVYAAAGSFSYGFVAMVVGLAPRIARLIS
jgi:hypothetical protein